MNGDTDSQIQQCGDCGAMMRSDASGGLCVACLLGGALGTAEAEQEAGDETPLVTGYELIKPIGQGGAGEVWLATGGGELRKQVALKLLYAGKSSEEMVARFEAEGAVLARMNHPGIAEVYDAGLASDGRPYVAMEFIDGEPITTFAQTHDLSLAKRLALFVQVCQAVQHAHQNGIIHRDLKPSNIIACSRENEYRAVVIDFGISRDLDRPKEVAELFTHTGQLLGTPAYISPEQLEGNGNAVDTRTDVYALGMVLYELLTDTLPFDGDAIVSAGIAELVSLIQDHEPVKPSTKVGSAALKGELDWLVMKCLEKDPSRRYQGAAAVANDLERYLTNQPLEAGPPSTTYQMRKFVRRNRVSVIAATVVILAIIAAAVVSLLFGLDARRAERLAERRAVQGEAMIGFLIGDLYDELKKTGRTEALLRSAQQVDAYYAALPEAADSESIRQRARALVNVSKVNRSNLDIVERALELYESAEGTPTLEKAEALLEKATVHRHSKQGAELVAVCDQALSLLESEPESPPLHRLRARLHLAKSRGFVLSNTMADRRYDSAVASQKLAEEEALAAGESARDELIESRIGLALDLLQLGKLNEAAPYAAAAEPLAMQQLKEQPSDLHAVHRYAQALETRGALSFVGKDLTTAKSLLDKARGLREDLWRSNPKNNDFRFRLGKNLRLLAQVSHDPNDLHAREYFQLAQLLEEPFAEPGLNRLPIATPPNATMFANNKVPPAGQDHAFVEPSLRRMAGTPALTFDRAWQLRGENSNLILELDYPKNIHTLTLDHFATNVLKCHALAAKVVVRYTNGAEDEYPFFVRDTSLPAIDMLCEGSLVGPNALELPRCGIFSQTHVLKDIGSPVEAIEVAYAHARDSSRLYVVGLRVQ